MGKLTDWRMNKLSKLTYNETRGGYETTFIWSRDTIITFMCWVMIPEKGRRKRYGGSYYDTENDYCIYVYHRKFGTYYDQLIGIKKG